MKLNGSYRHELKFQISLFDYYAIRQRLRAVMKTDPHTSSDGTYLIRSIYFDNYRDKALLEKINGVPKREKYRIRYYNDDFSRIALEKKIKNNGLCMKISAVISESECRNILDGDTEWMLSHPSELVRELACKMKTQQLRPRVLVSYVREPYIYGPGNVRVTFDSQIRTTMYHNAFLEETVHDIPTEDQQGTLIMEVKYDAFLPDLIADLLQNGRGRVTAFSKYGISRRFG